MLAVEINMTSRWLAIFVLLGCCGAVPAQTEVKLTASDTAAGDLFGFSVSVDGDTALVGASADDSLTGAAYVFSRHLGGADAWGQAARLTATDGAPDHIFGSSVSVYGDTALVGAPRDDDGGTDSGSAYVVYGPPVPVELQTLSVK